MHNYRNQRVRRLLLSCICVLAVVFCFLGVVGIGGSVFAASSENEPKIYHVPASKIEEFILKSKGRRRVIFVWKSTDELSRRALPDYADLSRAHPGSVISISVDTNIVKLSKYMKSVDETSLRTLVVKPMAGENFDKVLSALGVKPASGYPLIVLLNENNLASEQGKLFIDYVADYILSGKKEKQP